MAEPNLKVETTARLAQWKIETLTTWSYRRSDPFRIGLWNWHLSIEKNRHLHIRLFPEVTRVSREQPPIATFVMRVLNMTGNRRPITHPEVTDKLLRTSDDFVWPVEMPFYSKFIIDVEFLDLKTVLANGGEPCSIWSSEGGIKNQACQGVLKCLTRMFDDGLHCDVTISTSNGSIGAHRAILSARSPVFESMFIHDLREKESSIINIDDMSLDACKALLSYIYGRIDYDEFQSHRADLLRASDKYDISDLKEACEESLMEDIDTKNVLGRLQDAWIYHLPCLKRGCLKYLLDFGKVFDVREELNLFLRCADRDLIMEMFQELLNLSRG